MVYIDRRRYNIFSGSTFTKPVAGSSQAISQPPETDCGDKMDQAFPLYFCILQVIKNWTVRRPGNEVLVYLYRCPQREACDMTYSETTLNTNSGDKEFVFFLTG